VLPVVKDGKPVPELIPQTASVETRAANARVCVAALKLSVPTVVDRDDNKVNAAYAGWPDRLYVVGSDGTVVYKGSPGPAGFKPGEVEAWLRANLK
jgi:hypothetical protein